MNLPPRRTGRKLLVASLGVATMAYLANSCASARHNPDDPTTGGGGREHPVGNLAPPPDDDASTGPDVDIPVANLVAPPIDSDE